MHDLHLINDIAIALALAFGCGLVAHQLRLSPIIGYLIAGLLISPYTSGYDADLDTMQQLAELGVIFLMFGVGLHFNTSDLLDVKGIAIPGALIQIVAATGIGMGVALAFGLGAREGVVLGLSLSVASTVVLVRALDQRDGVGSVHGRVAVGWLIVEDLATVFFLVLIPLMAPDAEGNVLLDAGIAVAKAAVFIAIMLVIGARVVPRLLSLVAHTGSRELFILAVVAGALGIATSAMAFGLSVALGAFVAGVVVSDTETSHQAAADVLPFRDAFAVLFFVSVGMLLDVGLLLDHLGLLLAAVGLVLVGKSLVGMLVVSSLPYPARTGLVVAAGLAQVGEFSFILAREGVVYGLISDATYNVILGTAVITIALNPLAFVVADRAEGWLKRRPRVWRWADRQGPSPTDREHRSEGHVVIAGYGRIGALVARALSGLGLPYVVVESKVAVARELQRGGVTVVWGDAANPEELGAARLHRARLLALTLPDMHAAELTIDHARRMNTEMEIIARARDEATRASLIERGASHAVVPEYEGGLDMVRRVLELLDVRPDEITRYVDSLRGDRPAEDEPSPWPLASQPDA